MDYQELPNYSNFLGSLLNRPRFSSWLLNLRCRDLCITCNNSLLLLREKKVEKTARR
jgi:hypothetical protein